MSNINELQYRYKFEMYYGSNEKAIYYFEQLWRQKGFKKNVTTYKKRCLLYYNAEQYDKVIEVSEEYFKSNARKTKNSPQWFNDKIKEAKMHTSQTAITSNTNRYVK